MPKQPFRKIQLSRIFFNLMLISFFFFGCSSIGQNTPETAFRPPTMIATVPPLATPTVTISPPTATPQCSNYLRYIQDSTIPDGTLVSSGDVLDKRWLVENSGTCNWDNSYSLQLITGPGLGANPNQALYPARTNTQFELQIIFKAPDDPGIYRSAWQAFDNQDIPFGDPIYIEIVVQ